MIGALLRLVNIIVALSVVILSCGDVGARIYTLIDRFIHWLAPDFTLTCRCCDLLVRIRDFVADLNYTLIAIVRLV